MWKTNQIQQKFFTSSEDNNEQIEKLLNSTQESIFKLRRLRLQMERTNGIQAKKKLFDEHTNVNFEVESVEIEKMNEYFSLSEKQRMEWVPNNIQDNLIKRLVYR